MGKQKKDSHGKTNECCGKHCGGLNMLSFLIGDNVYMLLFYSHLKRPSCCHRPISSVTTDLWLLSELISHHGRLYRQTCIILNVLLTNTLGKTFLLVGGKSWMVGPYSYSSQHEALSTETTVQQSTVQSNE